MTSRYLKKFFNHILVIVLIVTSFSLTAQNDFFETKFDTNKNVLILLHPTVSNIKNFIWLKNNDIVQLENTALLGIYYEDERYDYQKSRNYLDSCRIENFYLQEFKSGLTLENVFQTNFLSANFNQLIDKSNGIIFFGGPDIPPYLYGEKTNLLTRITDPYRHFFETSLLFHLLGGAQNEKFIPLLEKKSDYIVWAFCLGMQTMNIATGGTLIQDIPSEIYNISSAEDVLKLETDEMHKNYNKVLTWNEELTGANLHHIKFSENGFFTTELKSKISLNPLVYSYHHQCIEKLGKNLIIEATSMDGKIIESVTHKIYKNVIAFQFHPEKSGLYSHKNKYQFTVTDTSKISYFSLLENTESLEFNKSIWQYFSKVFNESIK